MVNPASAQGIRLKDEGGAKKEERERLERRGGIKKKMGSDYGSAEQQAGPGIAGCCSDGPQERKRENYGLWGWRGKCIFDWSLLLAFYLFKPIVQKPLRETIRYQHEVWTLVLSKGQQSL